MYYLIKNDEIVGKVENPDAWEGWQTAEFEDAETQELYWNGTAVAYRPAKPASPYAAWVVNEWVVNEPPVELPLGLGTGQPSYKGVETAFRSTEIFGQVFTAAASNLTANAFFTVLMSGLQVTHELSDFVFGFTQIRPIMAAMGMDFNEEQLGRIVEVLTENNFDPADFGLSQGDEEPEEPEAPAEPETPEEPEPPQEGEPPEEGEAP